MRQEIDTMPYHSAETFAFSLLSYMLMLLTAAVGSMHPRSAEESRVVKIMQEPMSSAGTRDGGDAASEWSLWVASAVGFVISRADCINVGRSRRIIETGY
jgi:hypothetical protein